MPLTSEAVWYLVSPHWTTHLFPLVLIIALLLSRLLSFLCMQGSFSPKHFPDQTISSLHKSKHTGYSVRIILLNRSSETFWTSHLWATYSLCLSHSRPPWHLLSLPRSSSFSVLTISVSSHQVFLFLCKLFKFLFFPHTELTIWLGTGFEVGNNFS